MDGKFLNQRNLKNSNKRKHHFCTAGNSMEKGIRERVHECSSSVQTERIDSELQIQVSQIF